MKKIVGVVLGTVLMAALAALAADVGVPKQQFGVEGAINRCRDRTGKVVYVQRPCANVGMEQLGVVRGDPISTTGPAASGGNASGSRRMFEETGGDGIIWIDPATGGVQAIPIVPSSGAVNGSDR